MQTACNADGVYDSEFEGKLMGDEDLSFNEKSIKRSTRRFRGDLSVIALVGWGHVPELRIAMRSERS